MSTKFREIVLLKKHLRRLKKEEAQEAEAQWFFPLKAEDIEEKIRLNIKEQNKDSLVKFKKQLQQEKYQRERMALKKEQDFLRRFFLVRLFTRKRVFQSILRLKLQSQNLKEQIDYIENKIEEL